MVRTRAQGRLLGSAFTNINSCQGLRTRRSLEPLANSDVMVLVVVLLVALMVVVVMMVVVVSGVVQTAGYDITTRGSY